jgi:dienelactone hydrolase
MNCRHVWFRILFFPLLVALVLPLACAAQAVPPPRVVDLTAPDGVILKASFFAAAQPGPGVLLLHQCNRQRRVWDGLAAQLAAAGLNVLTFDFRGYGDSTGKRLDQLSPAESARALSEQWPADVDVALRYLQSQPGVNRGVIGAGGASCGVNQAVQLARRHTEVKSLVLLSEGTDLAGRQFLRAATNLPLFLAVADDDPDDPGVVEIVQWLYDISRDPANKFVRYAVGGHGVEMFAAHKELPGMIVDWFNATLRNSPAPPATHALPAASAESRMLDLTDEPDGLHKVEQMFAEARRADPKAEIFSEALLNRFGYGQLAKGDSKAAIEIFQLNVTAYPNSPNVYDSLGDAYLADGQKDLARQNAKKALELLASDTTDSPQRRDGIRGSAEQKLKQLGSPAQ